VPGTDSGLEKGLDGERQFGQGPNELADTGSQAKREYLHFERMADGKNRWRE